MRPSASGPLSTTSYAILGLLSLRSWTGYELAQQGKRSLHFVWPKGESVIYEEPRRLVARGLATASQERQDGRTRNRYQITDAGRAELRAWLASPAASPRFELEPVLRLLFADQGEVADVLATVAGLRRWAEEQLEAGIPMVQGYRDGTAPFPERRHLQAIGAHLLGGLYDHIIAWAEMAETEFASWERAEGGSSERTNALLDAWLAAHPPAKEPAGRRPQPPAIAPTT